jgi:hypothetical protein
LKLLDNFLQSKTVQEQAKSRSKIYLNSKVVDTIKTKEGYDEPMAAAKIILYGGGGPINKDGTNFKQRRKSEMPG